MKMGSAFAVVGLAALMASWTALPTAARADGGSLSVKINSFTRIGDVNSTLGELCGSVAQANGQPVAAGTIVPVSVTADPNTSNPGVYTVLADRSGNFCVVINTYTGTASADAWLPGSKSASASSRISAAAAGKR